MMHFPAVRPTKFRLVIPYNYRSSLGHKQNGSGFLYRPSKTCPIRDGDYKYDNSVPCRLSSMQVSLTLDSIKPLGRFRSLPSRPIDKTTTNLKSVSRVDWRIVSS